VSAWLTSTRHDITKHFSLEAENEKLMKKNAELMTYQPYSFYHLQNRVFYINDTLYEQQYEYIPAGVIKTSITRRDNYITINKGALQNVEPGMGVITNEGVVGFVMTVSKHYALVKTLLSDKVNISAKLQNQPKVRGQIKWDGADYQVAQLHGVTNDIKIEIGEPVVTKGAKGIFPEGILIGNVKDVSNEDGEITLDVNLDLSTNFKTLNTVYLVKNIFKSEQQQLEAGYFNE
ncbi:MAG: rod shape-determining protein MreC, partial [Putridiphycobacter sp.]